MCVRGVCVRGMCVRGVCVRGMCVRGMCVRGVCECVSWCSAPSTLDINWLMFSFYDFAVIVADRSRGGYRKEVGSRGMSSARVRARSRPLDVVKPSTCQRNNWSELMKSSTFYL